MKYPLLLIPVLIAFSCTSSTESVNELPEEIASLENLTVHSPDTPPIHRLDITREVSFGDTDDVFLGPGIGSTAVDELGRVYIPVRNEIQVYQPDGSWLRRIGREGEGPGEFRSTYRLKIKDDGLYILDVTQNKISSYDVNLFQHIEDTSTNLDVEQGQPSWTERTRDEGLYYQPDFFYVLQDNSYLIFYSARLVGPFPNLEPRTFESVVYSTTENTHTGQEPFSFPWTGGVAIRKVNNVVEGIAFDVPFRRRSRFDYNGNYLIYGWTEDFLFKTYTETGTYQKAFYYPMDKISFHEDQVLERFPRYVPEQDSRWAGMRTIISDTELPETWPAYQDLILDDENRIWISTFTSDPSVYEWWVLGENGELLATFDWPIQHEIRHIKNNKMYSLETDDETGLQEIVRYRLDWF